MVDITPYKGHKRNKGQRICFCSCYIQVTCHKLKEKMKLNSDIKLFLDLVEQNSIKTKFKSSEGLTYLSCTEGKRLETNERIKIDLNSNEKIINDHLDISTVHTIFLNDHPDGEGPIIVADQTGSLFKFYSGINHQGPYITIDKISRSIWDFNISKSDLENKQNVLITIENRFDKITIPEINETESFIMDDFKLGFNYPLLVNFFFQYSDNNVESIKIDEINDQLINLEVSLNELHCTIRVKNMRWYDPNFSDQLNETLSNLNENKRLCIVTNSDTLTGYYFVASIQRFNELKRMGFITSQHIEW